MNNLITANNNDLDLTASVPAPKTMLLTNFTSQMQHKKKCTICRHPQVEEINNKIKYISLKHSDLAKYGITEEQLFRHIDYMDLFPEIQHSQRIMLLKNTLRNNEDDAPYSFRLGLGDQYNKIAGVYKDNDNSDKALISNLVVNLLNDTGKQAIAGGVDNQDVAPLSESRVIHTTYPDKDNDNQ